MKAKIIMVFNNEEYVYGEYDFETDSQKNHVNELAIRLRSERNCDTYIKKVGV